MDGNKKANITIGIGLTTTPNRKHLLDAWLINFRKHTKEPYHLHIHEDINYRGVAYSKNENLKALRDCDYIFLFDDDCFPIHDEWVNFFISSGESHLLYMIPKLHGEYTPILKSLGSSEIEEGWYSLKNDSVVLYKYNNCGGVFMMLTKEVVAKVGAFGNYGIYGFEHCGYSQRIYKAGFTNAPYQMLKGTDDKLKALDYELDYEGLIKSSVSDELKQIEIEKNRIKFIEEVNNKNYFVNFV